MTLLFGPTMTACRGAAWLLADGLIWTRFEQAARRKTCSVLGPDVAVRGIPWDEVGPFQGVQWSHVEPS